MSEIPSKYDHLEIEEKWGKKWDEWGIYRWDPRRGRDETFVVDTPPPTVSGSLHVGHVFSYTHQDLVVRYQRMQGKNIAYPMGWDDNGLPTERRVQNLLGIQCNPHLPYAPDWKPERKKASDRTVEEVSRLNFIEACAGITEEDEQALSISGGGWPCPWTGGSSMRPSMLTAAGSLNCLSWIWWPRARYTTWSHPPCGTSISKPR